MLFPTLAAVMLTAATAFAADQPSPPMTAKVPHETKIHGLTLVDNYFWLREREDPKVIEYLKAENAYTEALMAHTKDQQKALYDEILGRVKQTDLSVPYTRKGYWYYSRTEEGQPHPIYCRKQGTLDAPEQVMLDVNELAKQYPNIQSAPVGISPDGQLMAYAVDPTGGRINTIYFRDLKTGKDLPDKIENASGDLAWGADSKTVFFTTLDPALRPDKAHRVTLGSGKPPEELYNETDERFFVGLGQPLDESYIMLTCGSSKTTEVRYLKSSDVGGAFQLIEPRRQGVEYSVDHHDGRFFIAHNDGAVNFTIVEAPETAPGKANWKPVVAHSDAVYIQGMTSFKDHLVITCRENGLPAIKIREFGSGAMHTIEMSEASYDLNPATNAEFNTTKLRFSYASPITPPSTFEYDMATKQRTLLKEQPVLGGYDRTKYTVERVLAPAADGEQVPLTLVYRKGLKPSGDNPTLLYGYGSYGIDTDAGFRSSVITLLDRGMIYAVAQIRGGSEKGRLWFENGRLMNKKNTFTDFISCAEWLVKNKWTNPQKLAIEGGSAGGLLVGAVTNMRPDLFKAVIAQVAFVDVMNTMLDPSLPLTVTEYEQWGNPNEKAAFDYMMSYSPYDNVAAKNYPAILAVTGFHDSNVSYWEPAKWVAKLREFKTGTNPVCLKINLDAGHGGASDRYKAIEERAFIFAWMFEQLGVK